MANAHRFYVPIGVVSLPLPPVVPQTGDTYFDTTLGLLQSWDGTAWTGSSSDSDLDDRFVDVPGDAMTGELSLPDQVVAPPSAPAVVAAKGYVDQLVTVSDAPPVAVPVRDGLIWTVVAAGPWTPSDITGLGLWLEADKITGLADGADVSIWNDASGKGHNAVSVTAKPKWRRAGMNGQPTVQFSNAPTCRLQVKGWMDALAGKSEYCLFFVLSQDEFATYPIVMSAPTNSSWGWMHEYDTGGGMYWGMPTSYYGTYDARAVAGAPSLYTASLGVGGVPKFYRNGTEAALLSGTGPVAPVTAYTGDVDLGGYWNDSLGMTGHIAAVIWYDRALSDVERQQVEEYLRSKYEL